MRTRQTKVSAIALRRTACSQAVLMALGLGAVIAVAPVSAQTVRSIPKNTLPVLVRPVDSAIGTVKSTATGNNGALMTITQQASRAVFDWKSFDIGRNAEVRFNQPGATSSALNRIYSADPSVLQGKLSANGQVILINQNGILFDRGAQVDAYSLIASTLNLSNDRFALGLTSGQTEFPAFAGGYTLDGDGSTITTGMAAGAIRLGEGGDRLAAPPSIRAQAGGSIVLVAPTIDNRSGVLRSPDGQVILAAGSKAYLSDVGANEQGLRGMLVEISADTGPVDLSSLVRNSGEITADRGNVTLAALAVNQSGRVIARTAALYNGSIWLQARSAKEGDTPGSLVVDQRGTVELAAGSVTATPIDRTDRTTIAESQAYASVNPADDRRGSVRVDARNIVHRGSIVAPGGRVQLSASDPLEPAASRIYLDQGSTIDVSGQWSDLDYESNLLTLRVTSNELKNSPDQRDGILRGQTVTVDLRRGSSLLDLSGYQGARERSVGEKAAVGGDIALTSDGDLIQRPGATLDVSGGGYRYGGGNSATTQLLGADGRVYDISNAPQQTAFVMQLDRYTDREDRWNQSRVYETPGFVTGRVEPGYVEGVRGGNLTIASRSGVVLDGVLRGGATTGANQLASAPRGGTLTVGTDLTRPESTVPVGNIVFAASSADTLGGLFDVDSLLDEEQAQTLTLAADQLFGETPPASQSLLPERFAQVEVNSRGSVTLPAGVKLDVGVGNALTVRAQQIDVGGAVSAPSGQIVLQTEPVADALSVTRPLGIDVRTGALLSTAGVWSNRASADGSPIGELIATGVQTTAGGTRATFGGGSVALAGTGVDVQSGAVIDVSGGGSVARGGRISGGAGGAIEINGARSGVLAFNRVNGDLRGHSLGRGGTLSVSVGEAQIGGELAVPDTTLRLAADWFTRGGFSAFSLDGLQGLTVFEGTALRPVAESLVVTAAAATALPSGGSLWDAAALSVLPDHLRPATDLALRSTGITGGVAEVRTGASITTDPGGRIGVDAVRSVRIDGVLEAPGGSIVLAVNGQRNEDAAVTLGATGSLLAPGAFVARPNDQGLTTGTLHHAGSISLTAVRGSVLAEAGSVIAANAVRQTVDRVRPGSTTAEPEAVTLAGNGGSVSVKAQDGVALLGTLEARGAGATASGGAFALELTNRDDDANPANTALARRIVVTQAPVALAAEAGFADATVDANRLVSGGFDKLRLQAGSRIELRNGVDLELGRSVRLDSPELRVLGSAAVGIDSPWVVLSNSFGGSTDGLAEGRVSEIGNGNTSLPVATAAGDGALRVRAGTIDLLGDVTVNGVSRTTLNATNDLRVSGRRVGSASAADGARLIGSLVSEGDIGITAAQVYPTTLAEFEIAVRQRGVAGEVPVPVEDGLLTIARSGAEAGAVLSAAGRLSLSAATIEQRGVLRAPLGQIALDAADRLTLADGSVTSVSSAGTTIPFGATDAGVRWLYGATNAVPGLNDLKAAAGKRIALQAPQLDLAAGSVVDVSGGGELQALEFIPGSGGSVDTLLRDSTFVILPAARLKAMPVDADIALRKDLGFGLLSGSDRERYDALRIGPGGPVPEGEYVLLPGRYAFVPGATLVQVQPGYEGLAPGSTARLPNGQLVHAATRVVAGTAIRDNDTIGVVLRPGDAAKRESDYNITGSSFFGRLAETARSAAPPSPADAGSLTLSASSGLQLDGRIVATPVGSAGRAAAVDIAAPRIAVVDSASQPGIDGSYLRIEADRLSQIGGSLLIGGTREAGAEATTVDVIADRVLVANSGAHPLQGPEILLAARDEVRVAAGGIVAGSGASAAAGGVARPGAAGAWLGVSGSSGTRINRGNAIDSDRGALVVEAGATVRAAGSAVLDSTRSTTLAGALEVAPAGRIVLSASRVQLGDVGSVGGGGLLLDQQQLDAASNVAGLEIRSYAGIDLRGAVRLGSPALAELTLDAGALQGRPGASGAAADARVEAGTVSLRNTGAAETAAESGSGRLVVDARRVVIGEGDKAISGFGQVAITGAESVRAEGRGTMLSGGETSITAGRVSAAGGSDQQWLAATGTTDTGAQQFALELLDSGEGSASSASDGLGARLVLAGRSVAVSTDVTLRAGQLEVLATGSSRTDGVTLRAGAAIDLSGVVKDFNGVAAVADAGRLRLSAAAGDVTVAADATVGLRGAGTTGDAGTVQIAGRTASVRGNIDARVGESAGTGGRFVADLESLADFAALNDLLDAGGFTEVRGVRVRRGDLAVEAGDTVTARHITLVADGGRIDVAGTLNASSARGGSKIELAAGEGIGLAGTSLLDARALPGAAATSINARPGKVDVDSRGGMLTFAEGAHIDVRSDVTSSAAQVHFTAGRDGANRVASDLRGRVIANSGASAAEVAVYGRKVHTGVASGAEAQRYASEHAEFMAGVDVDATVGAIRTADGSRYANAQVRGALELQTTQDFVLDSDWDLTQTDWLRGAATGPAQPGRLTIRAAGDLTIAASLGLPSHNLGGGLENARTWDIDLVGGADLASADRLATRGLVTLAEGQGQVTLSGSSAKVRTGTGDIRIAAARDFVIDDPAAVVYTTGVQAAPPDRSRNSEAAPNASFGIDSPWLTDGGSIEIRAGGDAKGVSGAWITDWLRRPRGFVYLASVEEWWSYRDNFRQGLATFGGGDLSIAAGGDVVDLSAMAPTSGRREWLNESWQLDVRGGGDVQVTAGNDIVGGEYLVSRGTGALSAGGAIEATQVYLMGRGGSGQASGASISMQAAGDIALQSVDDPMLLALTTSIGPRSLPNFRFNSNTASFASRSDDAALRLASLGGDISLGARPAGKVPLFQADQALTDVSVGLGTSYPGTLDAVAFSGDIGGESGAFTRSTQAVILASSATGSARLLAAGNVGGIELSASRPILAAEADATVAAIPATGSAPVSSIAGDVGALSGNITESGFTPAGADATAAATPAAGSAAVSSIAYDVQALSGSITESGFNLPARARFQAGLDIVRNSFVLQNLGSADVSVLQADAGDIRPGGGGISIGGPGRLLIQAGRDVDLGGAPLLAVGNSFNNQLATADSARLTVVAGVSGGVDLGALDSAFVELIEAGKANDDARAQKAMKTFFGSARIGAGNIDSFLTSIQSFGGSAIDLIAPAGNITVGLTTPGTAQTVGVVTNAGGAIRSFLSGDFNINQGKVVTAQGGDIAIYTSRGNIDAGRGAKTSTTTPPPRREPVVVDGVIVGYRYVLPTGVSGSGIQTVTSDPDGPGPAQAAKAGSVFLFAPSGFVDAGEAGIVSGADIFIAAQLVLNASNISAQGASVGVPQAVVGSLASSLAAGGTTGNEGGKAAEEAASAAASAAKAAAAAPTARANILSVEVLGFGDKNCKETDKDCFAK